MRVAARSALAVRHRRRWACSQGRLGHARAGGRPAGRLRCAPSRWRRTIGRQGMTSALNVALDAEIIRLDAHNEHSTVIDGAELLNDVCAFLGRFICYPNEHAQIAHALWIAHTHLMEAWETTPRLAFLSP